MRALRETRARPGVSIRLVVRLLLAQAAMASLIGFSYSRRQLSSILITLMLVMVVLGIALLARSGSHAAWMLAIGFESAYVAFGLWRFVTSRYVGGTLLGIILLGALLHPAIARSYSGRPTLGPGAGTLAEHDSALGER
jgi:hypothetical protein